MVVKIIIFEASRKKDLELQINNFLQDKVEGCISDIDYKPISYLDENNNGCILYTAMIKYIEV